jgi:hypothetical protein
MKTTTINQARHEANIAAKAATLFADGYTMKALTTVDGEPNGIYLVTAPAGKQRTDANGFALPPYIVDARDGSCTCFGYQQHGLCSHAVAIEEVIADGERADAECAAREEYETYGRWL